MRSRAKLARASARLLTLSTLLTAGLLIAQCIQIHEAGAFSREIVRARLESLAWAGGVWLALLVGTLLLRLPNRKESQLRAPIMTSRSTEERRTAQSAMETAAEGSTPPVLAEKREQTAEQLSAEAVSEENQLLVKDGKRGRRTAARFSTEAVPEEVRLRLRLMRAEKTDAMRGEERRRRIARGVCAGICAVCAFMAVRYLANPAHFASRELESVVGRMLWHIAPWTLVGFACAILCECFCGRSLRREIDLTTRSGERAPIENAHTDSGKPIEKKARLAKTAARAVVFVLAVGLLALGAANGGMRDVLVKAINICTECIGLG